MLGGQPISVISGNVYQGLTLVNYFALTHPIIAVITQQLDNKTAIADNFIKIFPINQRKEPPWLQ